MKDKITALIMGILILIFLIVVIHFYTIRVEKINNGSFIVVSDSECDK